MQQEQVTQNPVPNPTRNRRCEFCKCNSHTLAKCDNENIWVMISQITDFTNYFFEERYRSALDDSSNITYVYEELNKLLKVEMKVMNSYVVPPPNLQIVGYSILNKLQLVQRFISISLYKIYEKHEARLGREDQLFPREIVLLMKDESLYWRNVTSGIPINEAGEIFRDSLLKYLVCANKFPITNKYIEETSKKEEILKQETLFVDCCVCMESKETVHSIQLNCCHEFCGDCITQLIEKYSINYQQNRQNPSCPLCRNQISMIKTMSNSIHSNLKKYCSLSENN